MIVHSDSFFGIMLILLVMLATAFGLLASVVLLLALKYRAASRVFIGTAAGLLVFCVLQSTILALTPQTIVKLGDSLCDDIWCIGVTDVKTAAGLNDVVYKVDVRIFSDAGRGGKIHANKRLFLMDEYGRRFPLIPDAAVIPFTSELAPQESINTTLTFAAAADSKQLYLTSESTERRSFVVRFFTGDWLADHLTFIHKPTLLRVL